jgi:hypothetical protein
MFCAFVMPGSNPVRVLMASSYASAVHGTGHDKN